QDGIKHEIWQIRIFSYAIWTHECTGDISGAYEHDFTTIYRQIRIDLFGRRFAVFQHGKGIFGISEIDIRSIETASNVCVTKEMHFQSDERRVLWSYCWPRRYESP